MSVARDLGARPTTLSPSRDAAREPVVLAVRLKGVQRALLIRELSESLPAAITLLSAGASGLAVAGASVVDRAVAVAELASSAWMLLLLRREVAEAMGRGPAPASDGAPTLVPLHEELAGIEWSGVAGATMLGVELLQRWHQVGRVQRPTLLLAAFTLYMALGGRRTIARIMRKKVDSRRPRLVLSPDGIDYRGSRRRKWTARWDDVAGVSHDAESVRITQRDGRVHELRARDHVDGPRLVAAVRGALPHLLPARLVRPDAALGDR